MKPPELALAPCCLVALALSACGAVELTPTTQQIPALIVNDACGANTTPEGCKTTGACQWEGIRDACPAGATCPPGVCVTPDPCAVIGDQAACAADSRCAWSSPVQPVAVKLCPLGTDCNPIGGYCHRRDASGGGCTCVRPLACPASGVCPDVACDCTSPPPETGGGGSGGGTCTCACPACAAGESCPPCKCDCGGGTGGGGSTGCGGGGTGTGGGSGGGTCTCACPACVAGESCPPCDCACGTGAVSVGDVGTGMTTTKMVDPGPAKPACTCPACPADAACAPCSCPPPTPAPVVDPCVTFTDKETCISVSSVRCAWKDAGVPCLDGVDCFTGACYLADPTDFCAPYSDAASCKTQAGCGWVELPINCGIVPCQTGACVRTAPVPGGGTGGCGCACPACVAGQSCPPCACDCCRIAAG